MAISGRAVSTAVAILLLLTVLLWFTWGTQRNISRGNRLLRWLQGGLLELGPRTTLRWLGSSAVELGIVEPREPFLEATVVLVLEPRDVPWFWGMARRRGRRDFLILRGRLNRSPRLEVEAGDPSGWTGGDRLAKLDEEAWMAADWGRPGLRVLHAPGSDQARIRPLCDRLAGTSGGVWRLSVRRDSPHLEVHVLPPDVERTAAKPLIAAFADLARVAVAE
jgi:hypothetical protein